MAFPSRCSLTAEYLCSQTALAKQSQKVPTWLWTYEALSAPLYCKECVSVSSLLTMETAELEIYTTHAVSNIGTTKQY